MSLLADPVLLLFVALGVGILLARRGRYASGRRERAGTRLVFAAWALGWIASTTAFGWILARAVTLPSDPGAALAGADLGKVAIVVLSGGGRDLAPGEIPPEALRGSSAERAIGAARVFRDHPAAHVIVTGRSISSDPAKRHEMVAGMAALLAALGVPQDRIHLEPDAVDTRQNATLSAKMARELGAELVVVVTSALHVRRALQSFERAGIRAIAAPVDPDPPPVWSFAAFVPTVSGIVLTARSLHEIAGLLEP